MKLVDNAKQAWRWFSIQIIAFCVALQGASIAFPDTLRQYIPDWMMHTIAIVVLGAAVFGRLIKQDHKDG